MADKLLLMSAFICLALVKSIPESLRLPPYVPIIVISRDAIIVLGSIVVYLIKGDIRIQPSAVGKMTTFFQMVTIASVLVRFKFSYLVWNTATILTVVSGIDYLLKGSRLLNENHSANAVKGKGRI
jgi:phosphatidylglycerophosphate synthase